MSEGVHPFPSRTRQLSPPEPMVLGAKAPGRVGRRQNHFKSPMVMKNHGALFRLSPDFFSFRLGDIGDGDGTVRADLFTGAAQGALVLVHHDRWCPVDPQHIGPADAVLGTFHHAKPAPFAKARVNGQMAFF